MDIIKNKNKILAIIMVVLVVIIAIAGIALYNRNTLVQTKDTWTHEAGQELELKASEFFDADEEKAAQITFDTSAVDTDTVGEYTATAAFKDRTFEIKVSVVDTTAPTAEIKSRYVFTNDIENTVFDSMIGTVSESSDWSAKLVRFEKHGNLEVLDEKALKSLTDTIPLPGSFMELSALGTEEIPTEDGIYRAVLEIADEYGNSILEEVYVIYDTTGARIDDTPDKTVRVPKEDLDKEPEIDKNDYTITDNVDGKIDDENISCELELRDAEKHEWIVHVSYTDRAGNESKADFLIIVKEETTATNSGNGNTNNAGNGGVASNNGNSNNAGSGDSGNYDPADTDKDGVVSETESLNYISPTKQKLIDAGYGNVVQIDSTTYAVLSDANGLINGQDGNLYLRDYLAERGLEPTNVSGGWMTNDYYCYTANNVHELITPDDEEFWD